MFLRLYVFEHHYVLLLLICDRPKRPYYRSCQSVCPSACRVSYGLLSQNKKA